MGKALYEESIENDGWLQVASMYDKRRDAYANPYFPTENFCGFGINKIKFIRVMVTEGAKKDRVILSHINLLPVGWLIKKLSPRTEIILLAHGIEIWYRLGALTRIMLNACNKIVAVSDFTRQKVHDVHGVPVEKLSVLNNCLDPFLPLPSIGGKRHELLRKYGFEENDIILMTLTRLSSKERYKGYDKVIEAIAGLKEQYPRIKYLIAGSFDNREKIFVKNLQQKLALGGVVVLPGFIPDEDLEAHFAMSDIYVMPSRKEGFGLVFIEAMYYGLPVIAGNIDGSVDAVLNGELGQLVNPDDISEIATAITNVMENRSSFTPSRKVLTDHFGYEAYKQKLGHTLNFESSSLNLQPSTLNLEPSTLNLEL